MEKYFRVPLIFLFIGSFLGVLLRFQLYSALPGIQYKNLLHGHSHIMFLGWIFSAIYLAFVHNYINKERYAFYKRLFIAFQVIHVGMLISFPLQGYGAISIVLSTAHTLMTFVFCLFFYNHTTSLHSESIRLVKFALAFLFISSLGPFSLAYISSQGLQQSHWYNYAVYFYLHFQYNGFFFFSIAALFVKALEPQAEVKTSLRRVLNWLIIAALPTYFLSTLFSKPAVVFNIIGIAGALLQLIAFAAMLLWLGRNYRIVAARFQNTSFYLAIILAALGLKIILQLFSGFPQFAELAYELRPIVIAYLHLVLLGTISLFILLWYRENGFFESSFKVIAPLFLLTFLFMEILLTALPWWPSYLFKIQPMHMLLATSIFLSIVCGLFVAAFKTSSATNR